MNHDFLVWTWVYFIIPLLFLLLAGAFVARRPWWSRLPHEREDFGAHSGYRPPFFGGLYFRNVSPGPHPQRASARSLRNYRRSDERIVEDISDLLSMGFVDASNIEVRCVNGHVTLTGPVERRAEKRAVEGAVDTVAGVSDVTNSLTISKVKGVVERAA